MPPSFAFQWIAWRTAVQRQRLEWLAAPRSGAGRRSQANRLFCLGDDYPGAAQASGLAALARINRDLRDERRLGRAGHWRYDLERHIALAQAQTRMVRLLKSRTMDHFTGKTKAYGCEVTGLTQHKTRNQPPGRTTLRLCAGAAGPDPSSLPAPNAPRHSWGQPSDSLREGPISRDILPATSRNGCANGASTT